MPFDCFVFADRAHGAGDKPDVRCAKIKVTRARWKNRRVERKKAVFKRVEMPEPLPTSQRRPCLVSDRVEYYERRNFHESNVENRNRSRRVAQRKKLSIPLLSSLILPLAPVSSRIISSTICCTFGGRAQPIFGDYSVSHLVSNLFSSRPASSKHTKREEEKFPYKEPE